jgi:predicted nucleic acid-binding protein
MLIVYARDAASPFHQWAKEQIAEAVAGDGAAVNTIILAELCSDDAVDPHQVASFVAAFGVELLDLPVGAAELCGVAYRKYRHQRKTQSGTAAPKTPLPDFFIGAHAELNGWELVTNDPDRFRNYFPNLKLLLPPHGATE